MTSAGTSQNPEPKRASARWVVVLLLACAAMLVFLAWQPAQPTAPRAESEPDAEPEPEAPAAPAAPSVPVATPAPAASLARPVGSALPESANVALANRTPEPTRGIGMFGALRAGRALFPDRLKQRVLEQAAKTSTADPGANQSEAPAAEPKGWDALQRNWQNESYDPKWTGEMKGYLADVAREAKLDPKAVEDIDCRASACRVRFGFASPADAMQFQSSATSIRGYEARTNPSAQGTLPGSGSPAIRIEMMLDRAALPPAPPGP